MTPAIKKQFELCESLCCADAWAFQHQALYLAGAYESWELCCWHVLGAFRTRVCLESL